MENLTFADTHNMVAYLTKSNASAGFDSIVDFLNAQVKDVVKLQAIINRKKVVVSEDIIRQDLQLDDADGTKCLPTEEVFIETGKGFSSIETHLFATMLVQPQAAGEEEDEEDETCTTLSHKATVLKQDKVTQALEILKLKRKVKKLEKQRISKSSGLKRLRKVAIDADEDITLVDIETEVDLGAELQGRGDHAMAQILIKIKAEKARLLDEQMAKRLHDEEVKQAAAREKQEQNDFKRAQGYNSSMIKNKKTLIGMLCSSQEKHDSIFEEYGWDTPTDDPKEMSEEDVKNMLQIVPVSKFKVKALQGKYPLINWEIYSEGSRSYWKIVRVGGITQAYWSFKDMVKDFNREDLDALYMHDPLTWKLYTNCGVHQVSSTRRHDIFMFPKKDYPLTDVVLLLMLSTKLQVDEDCEMAKDLVMKILIKANKPKSKRSLDTSSK
uniref:Uncharacterized protein n=1 Tax=Tanacetum cinerariifolium TaxID=118510 RepID=A0A699HN91_TANCI|nr:hypothetical protein [Tanacetum cinerariifolium]